MKPRASALEKTKTKSDVAKTTFVPTTPVMNATDKSEVDRLCSTARCVKAGKNKLVALACSTGGPKSLQYVVPFLPANLDAPVVIVQHMPKGFTESLASRLNGLGDISVTEAKDGEVLEKGHVYIAPGGMHITIEKKGGKHYIKFDDAPPVEGLKPCANIMYKSLTMSSYDEITCVVLTGMGADGTAGIGELKNAGCNIHVIGQDKESCVVYGMPRAIAEAGLADEVVPLNKITETIIKNVGVM
jgi:two-component system chemotaxis response regulator CheB